MKQPPRRTVERVILNLTGEESWDAVLGGPGIGESVIVDSHPTAQGGLGKFVVFQELPQDSDVPQKRMPHYDLPPEYHNVY